MDYGVGYIKELNSLKAEIKRLNDEMKKLRIEKKSTERRLYEWMKIYGHTTYENYRLELVKPKTNIPRKKKNDKIRDALVLFRNIGIPDPEEFYEEFKKTQILMINEN